MAKSRKMAKSGKTGTTGERRNGVREVGALLPDVAGTAFRRFGFSQAMLVSRWAEIVGPGYARWSTPESLRFPRGQSAGATLTVRAEGAVALQLQHIAPQLVERVNRMLGGRTVERLKLVQGEVPSQTPDQSPSRLPGQTPGQTARRPAPPAAVERNLAPVTAESLAAIEDDGLRAALLDLAAQLQARDGPPAVR